MVDKTMKVSLLLKDVEENEAKMVLKDIMETMEQRLQYWGYGLETHSPHTLMGELK